MSDEFTLDVRQAGELANAFERNGWTNADIKKMSSGKRLAELRSVIQGLAKVVKRQLLLDCSKPLDLDALIGRGTTIEESDLYGMTARQIDVSKISFATCLQGHEGSITGEAKLRRLYDSPARIALLGAAHCQALWEDYEAKDADSMLEWLRRERGITYLDFFGDVVQLPSGIRGVLYLLFSEELFSDDSFTGWRCSFAQLDASWGSTDLTAVIESSAVAA